jgi:hypothetical protein
LSMMILRRPLTSKLLVSFSKRIIAPPRHCRSRML